jgi:hypothetical protein
MDLSDPIQNLTAFAKAQTSLDPDENVVIWFEGSVYSFIPGERSQKLLGFEGYNIRRSVPIEGGFQLLTREAVFYKRPDSDEILETWSNPLNGRNVEVVHVLNDPVNNKMSIDSPFNRIPWTEEGDDVYFYTDVFLAYPSPMPRVEYPLYSQADLYQGAELFNFFCKRSELEDPAIKSASCQVSWTRIGPWLPWMEMEDRPGNVVYHCRGKKLMGGYATLPAYIRDYVEAKHPEYQTAPTEITGPNETSWTYFKKILAQRGG